MIELDLKQTKEIPPKFSDVGNDDFFIYLERLWQKVDKYCANPISDCNGYSCAAKSVTINGNTTIDKIIGPIKFNF